MGASTDFNQDHLQTPVVRVDDAVDEVEVGLAVLDPKLFPTHPAVRDFVAGESFEALSTVAMSVSAEGHDEMPESVREQGLAVSSFIARDLAGLAQACARDPEAFGGVGVAFDKFPREDVLAFAVLAASQAWTDDIIGPALRVLLDDQAEDEGGSA